MLPSVVRIINGGWKWGMTSCKIHITSDIAFCSASIYSLIGISLDRHYAVYHPFQWVKYQVAKFSSILFRYAIKRKLRTVTCLILGAWFMALVISLPMHIDAPGFSNFNNIMNKTTILDNNLGGCMPPVDPLSSGFVLYSSILAFFIPALILGGLQSSLYPHR